MAIPFERDFTAPYDSVVSVAPRIRRLLARNPGPFTFRGTGVTIVGQGHVVVIDPGPDDPHHLAVLRDALKNETVTHILVTHTHRDHSPASRALEQWTGAKTYGFGPHGSGKAEEGIVIEEGGDMEFRPDIEVRDGDVIQARDFSLACVHTPGHTSNHICYALLEEKALFSGDHVMGWSTTVVAPPDGDMAQYLRSLEKLLETRRDGLLAHPWRPHSRSQIVREGLSRASTRARRTDPRLPARRGVVDSRNGRAHLCGPRSPVAPGRVAVGVRPSAPDDPGRARDRPRRAQSRGPVPGRSAITASSGVLGATVRRSPRFTR